ncbi:hypothetical protein M8C21_025601 [Ambrosia artemisiifolia]|uniref:Chromatin modification-related protein MEAF6 n=1 Tax=Ambrosia artemisiifolia TaxID=4212 RepID=A0AAD5D7K0_AMBAR|nr:hypothetical protein M8C21_025601 [Ambrosia artemisiifolia]
MDSQGHKTSNNPKAMLSSLMSKRQKLQEELRTIEKQVYELETSYLQESSNFGNVWKGYEGFLSSSKNTTNYVWVFKKGSYITEELNAGREEGRSDLGPGRPKGGGLTINGQGKPKKGRSGPRDGRKIRLSNDMDLDDDDDHDMGNWFLFTSVSHSLCALKGGGQKAWNRNRLRIIVHAAFCPSQRASSPRLKTYMNQIGLVQKIKYLFIITIKDSCTKDKRILQTYASDEYWAVVLLAYVWKILLSFGTGIFNGGLRECMVDLYKTSKTQGRLEHWTYDRAQVRNQETRKDSRSYEQAPTSATE